MTDRRSPYAVRALLQEQGLRPRKRWGQNFLCDPNTARRIAAAADLRPEDPVIEIGPGAGALTVCLAASCRHVTAFELDRLLEPILASTVGGLPNVSVRFADFLEVDLAAEMDAAFGEVPGVVVANIPYYITTPIVERLLAQRQRVRRVVLLVQREMARRLAAAPGSPDCSAFSVFAQVYARVRLHGVVPPSVFYPPPEVTSEVVSLEPEPSAVVPPEDEEAFFRTVRAAFGQRRKALPNALCGGIPGLEREHAMAALAAAGIDPGRRGETLSIAEFAALAAALSRERGG